MLFSPRVTSIAAVAAGGGTSFAATTWNPADKSANIALSNGDRTATATSGAGTYSMVRVVAGKTTGKFYIEVACTGGMTTNQSVGIANATASVNIYLGDSNNSLSLNMTGTIFRFNTQVGTDGDPNSVSDIISIAYDLTNNLIWFRVNGGNWNNSGSNDPATGVGGIAISALGGGSKFAAWAGYVAGSPADACIANFGQSAFAYAVPSGFTAGWSV